MNIQVIITIIDFLLWLIIAANVVYALFFALASHLPKKTHLTSPISHQPSFLVLIPAYHEDAVIINTIESFLQQDYPKDSYQLCVISDHMAATTNKQLTVLPITLLQPTFESSSKAKALQYAISNIRHHTSYIYDYVVILDADNIVATDFLSRLSRIARPNIAIQCHRTAKNVDNDIAALDGLSEEINNSIFRRGHNRIGMSSALIGSGMCFNYNWFIANVAKLNSAVEDRELEALLMKQGIYIHYAEDIHVLDEKVSNSDNFQRQRLRWMTGQMQTLFQMLPYIPKAIITGNINYIDKTIQQTLTPRSILLVLTPILCIIATLTSYIIHHTSFLFPLKWWLLLLLLFTALYFAIPAKQRNSNLYNKALALPNLAWRMLDNLLHIRPNNKEFIHTTHNK
ncbi:Glycosyltransferase, catalytic subunit of cellulose synthase and poly-beta-1,6-N-acetylglucosamine synthase [Prevotella communis]|uniref:Glycosyltransferase, catalytic subunit of cellulose synthase and poly-beta-1,6-N-acetylglucosamine synthase n=1 Tax=Prevotella communis TaxID=2913614 RepID=A0A1H0ICL6_9BACT|nr:glycosyltransferase family 2 protein [Prevotella communis]SDO29148.1 Glycosyltransferase, catalytic subunit of cellulose synthase and poly-beta-1,6-N-acetylglucosamine synthase [Prevotella communis]